MESAPEDEFGKDQKELRIHNLRKDLTTGDLCAWLRSEGCDAASVAIHVIFFKPEGFLLPSDILLIFLIISGTTRVLAGRLHMFSPPRATGLRSSAPRAGGCLLQGRVSFDSFHPRSASTP